MELLTEKYRPKKIEDLVLINEEFGKKLQQWKANGDFNCHLLFYGPAGTGKSSSVNVILNELNVSDYIVINGSDKTGVDDTRKVIEYASVPPVGSEFKVVVFEEFERLSAQAQDSLKYVLEKYSDWCRFIFTTNNINKITQPIISRCEVYPFNKLDVKSFMVKILDICNKENIKVSNDDIAEYINSSYPDLRKCINLINQNIINGELTKLNRDSIVSLDKYSGVFDYLQNKISTLEAQKFLASTYKDDEYEYIYKILYNHLDLISNDIKVWDKIIVIIAKYLSQNDNVAFKDLNLMSCLCEVKESIMP